MSLCLLLCRVMFVPCLVYTHLLAGLLPCLSSLPVPHLSLLAPTCPLVVLYVSSTCPVVSYLSAVSCFFCSACTLLVLCPITLRIWIFFVWSYLFVSYICLVPLRQNSCHTQLPVCSTKHFQRTLNGFCWFCLRCSSSVFFCGIAN